MRRLLALLVAALLAPLPAFAGVQNDVPSCYAANDIQPAAPGGYTRLIYVLIDQTVGWNDDLKASIIANLNANLAPGTKFVIAAFSAYAQGHYLEVLHTGIIEAPMPAVEFNNTPIRTSRIFSACLADQRPYAISLADDAVRAALAGSAGSLAHSDIMAALQAVSAPIAADTARQKILLLASDGLENSGAASFYSRGAARDIDPARELARAQGLLGHFGGASVYVIGGALPPPWGDGYQPPKLLNDLATFWRMYFERSDASLAAFGEPVLLQPVQFQ